VVKFELCNSLHPIQVALSSDCHILSEKPAYVRGADFERLAEIAGKCIRKIMLVLCNSKKPTARKAREVIGSRSIDRP